MNSRSAGDETPSASGAERGSAAAPPAPWALPPNGGPASKATRATQGARRKCDRCGKAFLLRRSVERWPRTIAAQGLEPKSRAASSFPRASSRADPLARKMLTLGRDASRGLGKSLPAAASSLIVSFSIPSSAALSGRRTQMPQEDKDDMGMYPIDEVNDTSMAQRKKPVRGGRSTRSRSSRTRAASKSSSRSSRSRGRSSRSVGGSKSRSRSKSSSRGAAKRGGSRSSKRSSSRSRSRGGMRKMR